MWFKRSKRDDRNEKINEILQRIGNKAALLSAKTERLRILKDHYEAYLNRVYPIKKDYSIQVFNTRSRSYENMFIDEPSCLTYDLKPRSDDTYLSTSNRILNRPYLEDTFSASTSDLDYILSPLSERDHFKSNDIPEIFISSEFSSPGESTVFRGLDSICFDSSISDQEDIKYSRVDFLKPILTTTTYPNNEFFNSSQKTVRRTVTTCDNCERLRRSPRQTQSFSIRSRSYDDPSPRLLESNRLRSRSFSSKSSTSYLEPPHLRNMNDYNATQFSTSPNTNGMVQRIKSKVDDLKSPLQKNTYIDDRIKYNLEKSKLILDRYSKSPHTWNVIKKSDLRDKYIDDYLEQVRARRIPNYMGNFDRQSLLNKSFRLDDDDDYPRQYSGLVYANKVSSLAHKSPDTYRKPYCKHVTFAPDANFLANRSTPFSSSSSLFRKSDTKQNFNRFPSNSSALSWYKTNYTADVPDIHTNLNRSYSNLVLPGEKYMHELKKVPVYQRYLDTGVKESFTKQPHIKNEDKDYYPDGKIIHTPSEGTVEMNSQVPQISVKKTLDEPTQEVSEQFYRLQTLGEKPVETIDPLEIDEGLPSMTIQKAIIVEDETEGTAGELQSSHSSNTKKSLQDKDEGASPRLDGSATPTKENNGDLGPDAEVGQTKKNDTKEENTLSEELPTKYDADDMEKNKASVREEEVIEANLTEEAITSQKLPDDKLKSKITEIGQKPERTETNEKLLMLETQSTDDNFIHKEPQTSENVEGRQEHETNIHDDKMGTQKSKPRDLKTVKQDSKENLQDNAGTGREGSKLSNQVPESGVDEIPAPYAEQEYYAQGDERMGLPEQQYELDNRSRSDIDPKGSKNYYEEPEQQPYEQVHHQFEGHVEEPYEEYPQQTYPNQVQQPYIKQLPDEYDEQPHQPYDEHSQQMYREQSQPTYEEHLQQPYDKHLQQPYEEHPQQQYPEQQQPYEEHAYEQSHVPYDDKNLTEFPQYSEQTNNEIRNFPQDSSKYPEYEGRSEDVYAENQPYSQHPATDEYKQYDDRLHGPQEYHAPEEAYIQDRAGEYAAYQNDYTAQQREDYRPNAQPEEYVGHPGAEFEERRISKEYGNEFVREPRPQEEYREPIEDYRNADAAGQYIHHNEDYGHPQYEQREYRNEGEEYIEPNTNFADPSYGVDANYSEQREYSDHVQGQYSHEPYPQDQYARELGDQTIEHYPQDAHPENYSSQQAYPQQDAAQYEDIKTPRQQNEVYREPYYESSKQ